MTKPPRRGPGGFREVAPHSAPRANPFAGLSAGRVRSARTGPGNANACESRWLNDATRDALSDSRRPLAGGGMTLSLDDRATADSRR